MVPNLRRLAVLVDPINVAVTQSTLKDVEQAARTIGVQWKAVNASTSREIDAVFASFEL
jgi:hypothetical protein